MTRKEADEFHQKIENLPAQDLQAELELRQKKLLPEANSRYWAAHNEVGQVEGQIKVLQKQLRISLERLRSK